MVQAISEPNGMDVILFIILCFELCACALHSTYHTVHKVSPGASIFGRDMLFDILVAPLLMLWINSTLKLHKFSNKVIKLIL